MGRKAERRHGGESTVADPTGHRWQNGLRGGFYKSTEKPSGMLLPKESLRQRSSSPMSDSIPGMVGGFHVFHDPSPVRREPDRSRVKKHTTALHDIQNSLSELKRAAAPKNRSSSSYVTTELHKLRNKENTQHRQMKELKQVIRALNTTEPQHTDHRHGRDPDRGRTSYPESPDYADSPTSVGSDQHGRRAELQRLSEEIGTLLQLADNAPPRKSHSKKRSRSGHTPRTTRIDLTALTGRSVPSRDDHQHPPKVHQHPPQEYIYPTPSRRGRQRDKRRHQAHQRSDDDDAPRTPEPAPAARKQSTSPEWLKRARPSARPGSSVPEPQVTPVSTVRHQQQQHQNQVAPAHIQPPAMRQQPPPPQQEQVPPVGIQPPGAWSQTPQRYGGQSTSSVGVGSSPTRHHAPWPPRQASPPRHRTISTSPGPPVGGQKAVHSNVGGSVSRQTSPQPQQQQQQQHTPVQRTWASQVQQNQPPKVKTPPGNWGQQTHQQQQPQQQPAATTPWWDQQPAQGQGGWPPQQQQQQAQTQQNVSPPHPQQQQQHQHQQPHWVGAGTPVHERLPPPPWEQPATPEPALWNDTNALRGKVSHLEHTLQRKTQEQESTEQSLLKEIQILKDELGKVHVQQQFASQGYSPGQGGHMQPQYVPVPPQQQQQQQQCF